MGSQTISNKIVEMTPKRKPKIEKLVAGPYTKIPKDIINAADVGLILFIFM